MLSVGREKEDNELVSVLSVGREKEDSELVCCQ